MASVGVRVLPAVIAISIGALAFKGVDLAQAVAEAAEEKEAAPPETELTAGVGDHGEAAPAEAAADPAPPAAGASGPAANCLPAVDYAAEMGVSGQEILVLRSLAERRKALDDREAGITTREQMAAAAEAKLNDQIAGLKTLEADVQKLLAQMDAKRDERMTTLVKTYEGMKPAQAAAIFNAMEDGVLVELAKSMKPATLGPVMAQMDVKRAEHLTKMLAALASAPSPAIPPQKTEG